MTALPVTIDIGPAVHQGAGLSRYAERLAAIAPGPVMWPGSQAGLSVVAAASVAPMAACWH